MIHDLGQNFLVDSGVLQDIINAAQLQPTDVVLEIGPGEGVLTKELAKRVKHVIAVELDRTLVAGLQKKFHAQKNVTIIHDDILRWWKEGGQLPTSPSPATFDAPARRLTALRSRSSSLRDEAMPARPSYAAEEEHRQGSCLKEKKFKVVANLPYGITSRVVRMFLEGESRPSLLVLMVQKEVAERICAKPGAMSMLSVSVQYYATSEIVRFVPRTAFNPVPNVDSAVLALRPFVGRVADAERDKQFFRLVKIGFSSRRKQLHNLLASGLHISNATVLRTFTALGLDPRVRAQELSIDDWKKLMQHF